MNRPMTSFCLLLTIAAAAILAQEAFSFGQSPPPSPSIDQKDPQSLWVYRQSVALGVPESELSMLVASCREQGYITAEIQRIVGLIAKAKLAGLPHEDLLAKFREGLAKRAGPESVDEAVSRKALTLRRSKDLVDSLLIEGWSATDYSLAIKMVADSLDAGFSSQKIISVLNGDIQKPEGMPELKKVFAPM